MNEEKFFETIMGYKFLAKKEVGQNFLADPIAAKRIVSLLEMKKGDRILEIGSGAGSLSFFLSFGPGESDLIDIDDGLVTKLKNDFSDSSFVKPMIGNAMRFDYSPYDKIIGNLPYYITSGIIEKILLGARKTSRAVLMLQKEAAERLTSKLGDSDYSPLTLYLNYVASVKKAFNVPRTSFVPAPHVESTVIVIDFHLDRHNEESEKMYLLASRLFLYRRKTIYNNLRTYLNDASKASEVLREAHIPETARPEDLSAESYLALSRLLNC